MSEFYDEVSQQGLTKDVIEDVLGSPLYTYLKRVWTYQLNVLTKELETAKTYEELKFKLGQMNNIRYNLNILAQLELVIYPTEMEVE